MNCSAIIAILTFLFALSDGAIGLAALVLAGDDHSYPSTCQYSAPLVAFIIFGTLSFLLMILTFYVLRRAYKMDQTFLPGSPRISDYASAVVALVFSIWCSIISSKCAPTIDTLGDHVSILNNAITIYCIIKLAASSLMIFSIFRTIEV
jgi:hypothetical protein